MSKFYSMDGSEVDENLVTASNAKLHEGMCKQLSPFLSRVQDLFPVIEAGRPRSKSGIQALCSLHVSLDRAMNLLQHCAECSKLYLAVTGESILGKFARARSTLQESLKRVEEIVPLAVGCQIMEMVGELEGIVFALDQSEKRVGDELISLLQKQRKINSDSNDSMELQVFHQAALKLGVTSSRSALTERRALKKLIEKARSEEDKQKESIVAFLLHLMRKYSKLFRSEKPDDTDSQGSSPCTPIYSEANAWSFDRQISKLNSFNFKQKITSTFPEEFRCPISLQLMYDPVIISSGQTYERVCIEKWFKDGHDTCPKTQQKLSHLDLTPNYCVKGLISSWCELKGIPLPEGPPENLDLNYWRLALSVDTTDSRSMDSVNSCQLKEAKVVPLEEPNRDEKEIVAGNEKEIVAGNEKEIVDGDDKEIVDEDDRETLDDRTCQDDEVDGEEKCESLLAALGNGESWSNQCKAVEKLRFLLKDDEKARNFIGANGFVEVLVGFLRSAVNERDEKAQEVGAFALFNLAVNNNRNKEILLSSGVVALLEDMIANPNTCESATAVYLNLSCFDAAKPIIGSSSALPFLVCILNPSSPQSATSKHDALYALFNLSTHPSSVPFLLAADIIAGLQSLLASSIWIEKALAILMNLLVNPDAKEKMVETTGFISSLASVLDSGEPAEQELSLACLFDLCSSNENCSHMVLQEGVIPALVSLSVNGSWRAKEKAQKLLKLFREQRQKEQPLTRQPEPAAMMMIRMQQKVESAELISDFRAMHKSRSKRLGKKITSLFKATRMSSSTLSNWSS